MKLAITLPGYLRPDYSQQSLAALAVALDRHPVTGGLFVALEPGPEDVRRLYVDFVNLPGMDGALTGGVCFHRHGTRQGVNRNILGVIDAAFADGAEAILSVEDDIVLAPDGIAFATWALDRFRDDPRVLSVTLYNREATMPPPERWHEVQTRAWTHPWGLAIWRDRWARVRPHLGRGHLTWDCDLHMLREQLGMREVFPVLSRAQNIGVESSAAHVNSPPPSWYAENHVLRHWAGQVDVPPGEWRLVE